jgi:hemerythrin
MELLNSPISWDTKDDLGIPEIDLQHRVYVSNLNKLYLAWIDGKPKEEIDKLLRELAEHENFHFAFEEALIAKSSLPELAKHRNLHQGFREKTKKFIARYNKTHAESDLFTMLGYFEDWLISHMRKYDSKYALLLNNK